MNRRDTVVALFALCASRASFAQQTGKVWRIGYLAGIEGSRAPDAFFDGLRERGYVEGTNITVEHRFAARDVPKLEAFAAELVSLNVDLIVALATPAAQAARKASRTIPVVFWGVVDPIGAGLVVSLARPGGNATGLSLVSSELAGKRIELLRELVPNLSRVAILLNPTNASNVLQLREAEAVSRKWGIDVQALEVRAPDDLERAFPAAVQNRANALIVLDDPFLVVQRKKVSALASRNRLPAMYGFGENVEAGGLIAYGPSVTDQVRRVAAYAEKILKGTSPADLPVEQPMRFELMINLKTAKALGLKVPQSILVRSDRVIE